MDALARRLGAAGLGTLLSLSVATPAALAEEGSGWRRLGSLGGSLGGALDASRGIPLDTPLGAHRDVPARAYVPDPADARFAAHASRARPAPRAATAASETSGPGATPVHGPVVDASAARRETLATWGPWLTGVGVSDNARQLLGFLDGVGAHGLDGEDYDLAGLRRAVRARERAATLAEIEAADPWVGAVRDAGLDADERRAADRELEIDADRLDRRLEVAFARLAEHLGRGAVDARTVQQGLYRDPPEVDADALLEGLANGALDVDAALSSVMPTDVRYRRLTRRVALLLDQRARGVARTHVPEIGTNWVGHRHDDVMLLKRRLIETGDLPVDTVLTPMFDAPLAVAVEAFRARQGLAASGVVDPRTRAAMNLSLDEEIAEIALNLERWRWMPRTLGARHVFVNLPSYRVEVADGDQRIVDMRAVIGSTRHETPVFSRDMAYIEFNPTWTVPASIAHRAVLPEEVRSPGYLQRRGFDFLGWRDGKFVKVARSRVSRGMLSRRPFPYTLRQRPGPHNALGRMKFMFPNPYAIYLHDTPAKRHFALDERAYSSGCVRLQDPEHLAEVLLRVDGHPEGTAKRLLKRGRTARARLHDPLPVHMAYLTAWIDDDGSLQRRADVYRHDASLRIALESAGTLLGRLAAEPARAPDAGAAGGIAASIAWRTAALPG